jgi:hypothetical protein
LPAVHATSSDTIGMPPWSRNVPNDAETSGFDAAASAAMKSCEVALP